MTTTLKPTAVEPFILHFEPILKKITDEDFFELCRSNPELRIECTAAADLIIMPPTGGETGKRNFAVIVAFGMCEYIANVAQLGWLIDPVEKKVYLYRPGAEVLCLDNPETVAGDPLLKGFRLSLEEIW